MKQTQGIYCGIECEEMVFEDDGWMRYVFACGMYYTKKNKPTLLKIDRTANQIRRCAACMKDDRKEK